MLLQTMLIIRRELLTFYVDMKLSNETDLDKIVQRYRVANDPDIYLGGEGEAENETQFLLSLLDCVSCTTCLLPNPSNNDIKTSLLYDVLDL